MELVPAPSAERRRRRRGYDDRRVIIGVLIMGIVNNAMNRRTVPPFYPSVASGEAIA